MNRKRSNTLTNDNGVRPISSSSSSLSSISSLSRGTLTATQDDPLRFFRHHDDLTSTSPSPSPPAEWAKQLLALVPRDADGQQVVKIRAGSDSARTSPPLPPRNDPPFADGRKRDWSLRLVDEQKRREREKEKEREREREKEKEKEKSNRVKERVTITVKGERQLALPKDDFQDEPYRPLNNISAARLSSFIKRKNRDLKTRSLPSIGLDEKLKKLNTRVKGFLNTNTIPRIPQKFRQDNKRNNPATITTTKLRDIDMHVVDNLLKTFEDDETQESRPGGDKIDMSAQLSQHSSVEELMLNNPEELQKVNDARVNPIPQRERRLQEMRLLAQEVSQLEQRLGRQAEDTTGLQNTCTTCLSSCQENTSILVEHVKQFRTGVARALVLAEELDQNLNGMKKQLDSARSATSGCSEQIKQLDINVQKVQRARYVSPADIVLRSVSQFLLVIVSVFYLLARAINWTKAKISRPAVRAPPPQPLLPSNERLPQPKSTEESVNSAKIRRNGSGLFVGDFIFSSEDDIDVIKNKPAEYHNTNNYEDTTLHENKQGGGNNNSNRKDKKLMQMALHNLEAMTQQIHKLQQMEMRDVQ